MTLSRILPHLIFLISAAVFTIFSKSNFLYGYAAYFPLYCYAVLIATSFLISLSKRECFSGAFNRLSSALYFFSVLLIAPVIQKVPFPQPHDFAQRKYEVLLGTAYAAFFISYLINTARMLVKSSVISSLKEKQAFTAVFMLYFIFFVSISFWLNRANAPTGDEPIYLLASHSMANDFDIDLRNNYEKKDYSAFFPGELKPQEIEHNGKLVPYHPVLISALIAPFYSAMGRQGATIAIAVICALIAALMMLLAKDITGDTDSAFYVSLFSAVSLPLIMFSNQICADTISALLITAAFYFLYFGRGGNIWPAIITGLVLWAHPRNIPVYGMLMLLGLIEKRRHAKGLMIFIMANVFIAGLLFIFNFLTYGALMPRQTQADIPVHQVFSLNPAGIFGLLFDKEFGLFIYTPLYILLPAGFYMLFKSNRKLAIWCILMLLPYYALIASWADWRGGGGASPRFLLQALPFIVLPLSALTDKIKTLQVRLLLWAGLLMSAALTCVPWFRWSKGMGENWILKFASSIIKLDLNSLFPSFWVQDDYAYLKAVVLLVLIVWGNLNLLKKFKSA